MDQSINHFRLWQILCEDKIYGKNQFAKEICREFSDNQNLQVDVKCEDKSVLEFGEGSRNLQLKLLFSQDYSQALQEIREYQDIHDVNLLSSHLSVEPDQTYGLWQEIFLSLAAE